MQISYLTINQLTRAGKKHPYLLLRYFSGEQVAVNSKVMPFSRKKWPRAGNSETAFVGYAPCSFNEYISKKIPFIEVQTVTQ